MANGLASLEVSKNHVEIMSEKATMKDSSQQKTERFVLSGRRSCRLISLASAACQNRVCASVLEKIGQTPMVKLERLAKSEKFQFDLCTC